MSLPRPYFYRSRWPGKPCWTFGVNGRRFHAWPDHDIPEDDAGAADRWFLAKLAGLDPEVHRAVLGNRARRATMPPDRPVRVSMALSGAEATALADLAGLCRVGPAEALALAIGEEQARSRRELGQPPRPPLPASIKTTCLRVTPATAGDLKALAAHYATAWGLPRPNATMAARVAITRTLQCWPKQARRGKTQAMA